MSGDPGRAGEAVRIEENSEAIFFLARQIANLTKALSVSVLGITLIENPVGFILAVVLLGIRNVILDAAGFLAFWTREFFVIVGEVIVDVLRLLFGAFGGALAETAIGLISVAETLILGLVAGTGPFAPLVALLLWAALTYGLLLLLKLLIRGLMAVSPIP